MDKRSDPQFTPPSPPARHRGDRRTNRTRRQLKEALFALILEKGYDAVTIEDITDRADLGRTTFYLHYRDKEELLLESIDSISDELMEQISPVRAAFGESDVLISENGTDPREAIHVVFSHAAQNATLYLIILRGEGATRAAERVRQIIAEKVSQVLSEPVRSGAIQPQIPLEVFAHYFAGSLLGLITWWLEAGVPYSPDEMADIFRKLYFQGGRRMLGIE